MVIKLILNFSLKNYDPIQRSKAYKYALQVCVYKNLYGNNQYLEQRKIEEIYKFCYLGLKTRVRAIFYRKITKFLPEELHFISTFIERIGARLILKGALDNHHRNYVYFRK
ncbi:MAG: hypothetical protein K1060chlam5_00102 [Candidatus Anoxychlamydiales bacterium]|nr:hypothetical protein [Candidatus Anoxychlamydiales bacterium]